MSKWEKLIEQLNGVMDGNDILIEDCMNVVPIKHNKIQQLQAENTTIYKVLYAMELLEIEEG